MVIAYPIKSGLYVNLTNRCPCACEFCLRKNGPGVQGSDSLWLEREPTREEAIAAVDAANPAQYAELVFCGYGEPTVRADMLVKTAEYIKQNSDMKIRLNTNGLVRLIHKDFDINRFKGLIDSVSVSLNAPDASRYNEVTRPSFGEKAFDEMLAFSKEMKEICTVGFTVVDVISEEEISQCRSLAEKLGIPLRVRH